MWAMISEILRDPRLSFVLARGPAKVEGGYVWKSMDMCRDRWKDGRRTSFVLIYALVSTVSWLVTSEGGRLAKRELSHSKFCAGDRSRLCCFNSWRLVLAAALAVLSLLFKKKVSGDNYPEKRSERIYSQYALYWHW